MRRSLPAILLAIGMTLAGAPVRAQVNEPVRLHAAGSLRGALTQVARDFGRPVAAEFGPSGMLRGRIEAGLATDVFASANLAHPAAIAAARGRHMVLFARNRMCAIARPGIAATSETLLDRLLDPAIAIGTSTPRADPSGDYAWEIFARAETLRAGARATLEAKARKLVGGPDSPVVTPTQGRTSPYAELVATGAADIFLSYCTNARAVVAEVTGARIIELPPPLAVGAEYGLVVLSDSPGAFALAAFILSPAGQKILAAHGFDAPGLPVLEGARP